MKKIENIFSKSETKKELSCPNPKVPIIVDTREKQSLIAANLIEQKAKIEFEKLEVGDYLIGDTLIERKTFSDFIGSMINKRLLEQLKNLKKHQKPIILIEGFYYNYNKFGVHENAVRGMFLSLAADFQIPVIFTENEKDTSKFLILSAKKQEKYRSIISIRQNKKARNLDEKKQFVLEGFPEIGPTVAKKLLKNFSSLRNIFNAENKKLKEILNSRQLEKFKKILD